MRSWRGSSRSFRTSGREAEPTMTILGGVDVGATHLRAAVADAGDPSPPVPTAVERRPTPSGVDGTVVARTAADALSTVAAEVGVDPTSLGPIGVGTVGPLDHAAGAAIDPPNLDGVERLPLRDELIDRVGHDHVVVENDAVAGLVGVRAAMDDPPPNLVYLTLSTGVGAGVAVDDHVLRGRDGNAAEVGHLVVEPDGRRCGCGGRGHWEAYAGGAALPDLARETGETTGLSTDLPLDDAELDAPAVFAAADQGDPLAGRVIERLLETTAVGVADLVAAYAPSLVVIGGSLALENRARLIDPLRGRARPWTLRAVPPIRPATLGGDAVLRGALELARTGGLGGG